MRTATLTSLRFLRVPVSGGSPEEVFQGQVLDDVQCGSGARSRCVLGEFRDDQVTFSELDPETGRLAALARVDLPRQGIGQWRLSPDGRQIVWHQDNDDGEKALQFLSLDAADIRGAQVEGWEQLGSLAWCVSGDCIFATTLKEGRVTLLRVSLDGPAEVIPHEGDDLMYTGSLLVSPDGQHLAFTKRFTESSVWALENF